MNVYLNDLQEAMMLVKKHKGHSQLKLKEKPKTIYWFYSVSETAPVCIETFTSPAVTIQVMK